RARYHQSCRNEPRSIGEIRYCSWSSPTGPFGRKSKHAPCRSGEKGRCAPTKADCANDSLFHASSFHRDPVPRRHLSHGIALGVLACSFGSICLTRSLCGNLGLMPSKGGAKPSQER